MSFPQLRLPQKPKPKSNQYEFPPIRDIFIADPGHTVVDIDLEGADARVVAWRINSARMKKAFREGKKIHAENAKLIFKPEECGPDGTHEPYYTRIKKMVHATHYGTGPQTMAKGTGLPLLACKSFISRWLFLNPEVGAWHEEIDLLIQKQRGLSNPFGYRIRWLDRPSSLRNKALAWEPQSVVAEVTYRVLRQARKHVPTITPLMQVHDSLVLQIPNARLRKDLAALHSICQSIEVPYPDPLIIPWGLKLGTRSWGECEKAKWSDYI